MEKTSYILHLEDTKCKSKTLSLMVRFREFKRPVAFTVVNHHTARAPNAKPGAPDRCSVMRNQPTNERENEPTNQ